MSRDNAAARRAEGDVIVERTDDLFGPDGTADPPPDQWYPDPLAGLTPGEVPIVEQDHKVDPNHGVLAPAVATPDAEAVREAMEAVLAAEQEAPAEPPQRQRGRRSPSARPESSQPGRLPTRGVPPMVGGSNAGRRGWAQSAASKQATRQARARARQARPLRKQPGLLIVILLVLIVVFFNVLSSLFSWLSSAFH